MISNIYYKKKLGIPWISMILVLTCFTVWIATSVDNNLYYVFVTASKPKYFWQYFSGTFQHTLYPRWFFYVHFLSNMSVILLFGTIIERIIGSKKYLLLSFVSGSLVLITYYIIFGDKLNSTLVGISGVVWSYGPVVFYILIQIYKQNKQQVIHDKLFYLMIVELFFIWIFITALSSIYTVIWHLVATIVGIVFTIILKEDIRARITEIIEKNIPNKRCGFRNNKRIISLVGLIPLGVILIIITYLGTGLDKMFVDTVSISPCSTIEEINNNQSMIEIEFEEAFSKEGITSIGSSFHSSTNSGIKFELLYSEDRKKAMIVFNDELPNDFSGEIRFINGKFQNNKRLKQFKIKFD
ncbi:hypothetical protein SH2C18_24210 [Clostridium sediminicola]|uniref:rhomboid family intramembrane serine protease n=1 Tax=Clostridium sediminicola TaxID=3114879 RepID=UPI0031F1EFFD